MTVHNLACRLAVLAGALLFSCVARAEVHTIPLFVPASGPGVPQGMLRIVNREDVPGTVRVHAVDDAGRRSGPAVFTLDASSAIELTAEDLLFGTPTKGLSGSLDVGDTVTRLEVKTHLDIVPLAFVRADDGTLIPMHDTIRAATASAPGRHVYDAPVFHASVDATQTSQLRLINPGHAPVAVTIRGMDDGPYAPEGVVSLTLAAGGARTLTAEQLENGDQGLTGWLGAGFGRWRLTVVADRPLQVVNAVAAPTGFWSNLSTTAAPGLAPTDRTSFDGRFGDGSIFYRGTGRYATFELRPPGQFRETKESAGASDTQVGRYEYEPAGPHAGRLTAHYEDGTACAMNLYFDARDKGWFASRCVSIGIGNLVQLWGGTWSATFGDPTSREPDRFDLDDANRAPSGIAWSGGRLHVVDRGRDKVFAYGVEGYAYVPPEGLRHRSWDFELHTDNAHPAAIAWAHGRFYVLDEVARRVFAYTSRGRREATGDFDLDEGNSDPAGIVWANDRFYVLDKVARRVFAYGTEGRDPTADVDLAADNGNPSSIARKAARFYVVDEVDQKVYAYSAEGHRDAALDFDLHENNAHATGIVWADERFRVVDATTYLVYSYGGPVAQGD